MMDTSETYVNMCEKAVEIQELSPSSEMKNWWSPKDPGIWLPRQDQLQEMVGEKIENNYSITKRFLRFIPGNPESSMEQLWLAFVMKEKFNKTWDGENWVSR
jgi:hypothetical protein